MNTQVADLMRTSRELLDEMEQDLKRQVDELGQDLQRAQDLKRARLASEVNSHPMTADSDDGDQDQAAEQPPEIPPVRITMECVGCGTVLGATLLAPGAYATLPRTECCSTIRTR